MIGEGGEIRLPGMDVRVVSTPDRSMLIADEVFAAGLTRWGGELRRRHILCHKLNSLASCLDFGFILTMLPMDLRIDIAFRRPSLGRGRRRGTPENRRSRRASSKRYRH